MRSAPLPSERSLSVTDSVGHRTDREGSSHRKGRLLPFRKQHAHSDVELSRSGRFHQSPGVQGPGRPRAAGGTRIPRMLHRMVRRAKENFSQRRTGETLMKILILDQGLHHRIESTADPWPTLVSAQMRRRRSRRQRSEQVSLLHDGTAPVQLRVR